ncbi:UNVERIFIED_CONTAM: hypothetical protein FKN15_033929 [Acipenser sinensis]
MECDLSRPGRGQQPINIRLSVMAVTRRVPLRIRALAAAFLHLGLCWFARSYIEDQLPSGFPTIDMGPQLKVVERTRTATMLCAASGNPDPEITWFKDFLPVDTTNNNGRIKQLRSGRGPPSEPVETRTAEQAPSTAPRQVMARMLSSTTILVQWEEPEEANGQIQGYRVYYTMEPSQHVNNWQKHNVGDTHITTISGLTPQKTYHVKVLAFTSVGDGPLSNDIQVITKTGVPAQPTNFKAEAKSETSILLSWVPPKGDSIIGYELVYKKGEQGEEQHVIFEPDTSYLLQGLKPFTNYFFRLAARSSYGQGAATTEISAETPQTLPSGPPRKVEVEAVNSTSIKVTWRSPVPNKQHGQIRGYQVHYVKMDNGEPRGQPMIKDIMLADAQVMVISGLQPETTYSVTVTAYTTKGDGARSKPKLVSTTGAAVFAKNFHVKAAMKTSVLLTWEIPENYNPAQPFTILYDNGQSVEVDGKVTQKLITNLQPGTQYSFLLTNRGNSAGGLQHRVSTMTAPDVLRTKPYFIGKTNTDGMLTVELPAVQTTEKVKGYYIVVVPLTKQRGKFIKPWVSPDEMNLEELLKQINRTSGSLRLRRQAEPRSYIAAYFKELPTEFTLGDQKIYGDFENKPLQNGQEYIFFVLAVLEISDNTMYSTSPYSDPVVSADIDPQPIIDEEEGLIWVVGPVLAVVFIICIVIAILLFKRSISPLWKFVFLFFLAGGIVVSRSESAEAIARCSYICLLHLSVHYTTHLSIIILTGMASHPPIPIMELADQLERLKANDNLKFSQEYESIDPGQQFTWEHSNLEVNKPKNRYANVIAYDHSRVLLFAIEARRGRCESVVRLPTMANGTTENTSCLSIDPGQQFTWEHSNLEVNKPKNRYANVIAYDHSRVLLFAIEARRGRCIPGSDYVNSNYIDGYRKQNAYIATQGPLPETFGDFWRMIWEQRSANVVMMTKLEERSRVKCDQYWPTRGTETYGLIQVTLLDTVELATYCVRTFALYKVKCDQYWPTRGTETYGLIQVTLLDTVELATYCVRTFALYKVKCDQYWPTRGTETYGLIQVTLLDTVELATYCVRTFALYKNGSSEKREVRQFQFTAWPDHGVPEHPTPFLAFLRRVKACNPPDAGPMVVHCSAGVGRTGCFIVIDAMLERIKHEKTVDIYGHVTLMRAQRNYMVQTEDQYIFIHDALLEAVTCGTTEVPARNLYAYIQKLTQIESGENVTGMELEFKRLANTKAHTSRFISANLPCNKFKNRLVNIMPYESTRVCLQPIRGVEGSDYINGSFIDGYRQQKAYIATQGPLAETTEDFWRMLWEHNSTIVVMLTKLREMGREKCHQYWPAERSARYQYFVVDPMAEYNMPQYILREFKVTDARDGQSRTVRQFQFTDWPEQGVPKSGEGFIDFIGQVHKTKEQFGQDGPISVHCSAGVGRTGVFVTLSIVLERMRYEGVVDIFQTVKMLRTQRPAMVQTEDQYQFCYRAGLEYLGSFDHYAT